ncbi:hypothetical protein BN1088_1430042 [Sphingobacterium sp. PM2-P1-29]|nr:hypothetical protein BN1088_1430042 [Sphingobacterium sp. PM2-P1-29]
MPFSVYLLSTGTRIRTLIKGFGDLYSTVELFPCISYFDDANIVF